jgi:TolB-like protein/thioredoxin-like negative regulator of GroEL
LAHYVGESSGLVRGLRMTHASDSTTDRLDSWKEIAAYLRRGVRTVRRWEREEGLPVHRHVHRVLGSVYAFKSEIDLWQRADRALAAARESPKPAPDAASRSQSIAVLPFLNLSTDPENAYFADGLTDEISADLSKVRSLRVISRTSSATFKGTTKDARTIARELGTRFLLEGSVRRADGRLRITAQLIDAEADTHLWAEKYDGSVEDVFAIQERIARVIVEALELRLSADEDRRLAQRGIDNVHAYECYLRARQQGWRWRKDAIDQAIQLLRNGLALVGDSARLHAALGVAYLQYREAGIDFGEGPLVEAEACARKVFELEPESAAGLQLRGWIHYSRARIQEAVRDLKSALALEPNDPDTLLLLSNCYLISGRVPAARPLLDRLISVDPLTPLTRCMPAYAALLEGDLEGAIGPYREMFEMDPGNPMARLFYVWVLLLNRRMDAAAPILESFPPEVRDTVPARIAAFLAAAISDRGRDGRLPPITPDMEAAANATDVFARLLAEAYALAGLSAQSIHWIEVAIERGFINHPFLARWDPFLEGLRNEPRFVALMEVVRKRWMRFES